MANYISVKQMAEKLNVSLDTAYVYAHTQGFPATKVGRLIRINEEKLEQWLDKRTLTKPDKWNILKKC